MRCARGADISFHFGCFGFNGPLRQYYSLYRAGWSGGAKVLGKLPVPGRPTILKTVGQGPTALAVGAGGGWLDIFTLIYRFSSLSPSLWETAQYTGPSPKEREKEERKDR